MSEDRHSCQCGHFRDSLKVQAKYSRLGYSKSQGKKSKCVFLREQMYSSLPARNYQHSVSNGNKPFSCFSDDTFPHFAAKARTSLRYIVTCSASCTPECVRPSHSLVVCRRSPLLRSQKEQSQRSEMSPGLSALDMVYKVNVFSKCIDLIAYKWTNVSLIP